MIRRTWESTRDRFIASDPGFVRLRLALSAVLGIAIAIGVLTPSGFPLKTVLVGAVPAMMSAFAVNDRTKPAQAITLALMWAAGACSLTAGALGNNAPPTDSIVFVLLIFVAVYAQRFAPRGTALGSIMFFLFFFSMFLQTNLGQVPTLLLALAVGLGANAVVRFVLLPRRVEKELLRIRRAFRARLGAVVKAAATYLSHQGTERSKTSLRRANTRLHECVLMIEDTASDLVDERAADMLRRRTIEVELAVQWLSIITERTSTEALAPEVRAELIESLHRFHLLIGHDPVELPRISDSGEFSTMLVAGSRLKQRPEAGDDLRKAIAELALADVNAQRIADRDYSAETETESETATSGTHTEPTRVFAYDNTTRSAIQGVLGGGLAMLGGELVSPQRWYWAVLTVFVVFVGASTAGATFVKGARRLAGTLAGIVGGMLAALLVAGSAPATLALILVCVFCMVYTSRVSYVLMAFFITTMLGLIYSLLGTFSFGVLWIRVAETAIGAAAGALAAIVIVPTRTRSAMRDDVAQVLEGLREFVAQAENLLTGTENADIIELSRELDRSIDNVRKTVEPLTHRINISSARRDYGWYVLNTLRSIGFQTRHIAARSQPGLLSESSRLGAITERLTRNVETLLEVVRPDGAADGFGRTPTLVRDIASPADEDRGDAHQRSLLAALDQLAGGVIALGAAFDVEPAEQHGAKSVQLPPPPAPTLNDAGDGITGDPTHPLDRRVGG